DLAEMRGRPLTEIYRALADPSASIHPNYVAYTVAAKDGRVVVGVVRADGAETLVVTDTDAKATSIPRIQVEELRPSSTSIMPVGLAGVLGEDGVRDVLSFLAGVGSSTATPPAP
ncbi:heme-binding domain-containing protein, partial [Singulisphaera rosea]